MTSTPFDNHEALPWRAIKEPEWRAVLASTAALARSDTEDELLKEVCEAAVRAGGYLLAWYGRLVTNGIVRIHSIAASGPALDYLDDFSVTWAGDVCAPSAGGQAVDNGRPVLARDIRTDPAFAAWRQRADRYGIRSVVSIPVLIEGRLDGALTIYAGEPDVFDDTATAILSTLCQHVGVGMEKLRAASRINDALEGTIRVLTRALEARDPYTAGHQASVSALSEQIAIRLGMSNLDVQGIRLAALVHDIGKIGIPTELLLKPSPLREAEMALVREHALIGEEVLSTVDFPWPMSTIIGQHHERMDGSGYPRGLTGPDILLAARIIGVADVSEAMSRTRPYRDGYGREATLEYLQSSRGIGFDADVVDACVEILTDDMFHI